MGSNHRSENPPILNSLAASDDELNPAQRAAVEHFEGPLLTVAGPGSGKTRVITHRIARLLERGVPGEQILALTFTNKAANEMRARVQALVPGNRVWLGTFHRFCAQLLRRHASYAGLEENYSIYDTSDSRKAIKRVMESLDIDASHFTPERIASAISWAKNNLATAESFEPRSGRPLDSMVARVFPAYQALLLASNAVDFDDLLLHVATMLRDQPELRTALDAHYRFILVDEYQDTNLVQYAIVRALSIDYPHLAVTGDPDQSIYGWRGANLKNILEFERDYPQVKVIRLEQNYRSTPNILRVADALIAHNVKRKAKVLRTDLSEGLPVNLVAHGSHKREAEAIAARIAQDLQDGHRRARDFAVFYRVNALSRSLEFALHEQGVPYQIVRGVEFFQRKEIKDVLAYLHLLNNPRDDLALLRIINVPPRGIGKQTIQKLQDFALLHGMPLLAALRDPAFAESLNARSRKAIQKFARFWEHLFPLSESPLEEVVGQVLSTSGYQAALAESESEEDVERLANIEELLTVAREFDERHAGPGGLEAFLEETSLVNDTDDWEEETDRVTLMTLHASKGLEFPVVFITALEQGLLPHERSRESLDQLEEERRLLFVGITRAREELQLSWALRREFRGQRRMTIASEFLMELPREQMRVETHEEEDELDFFPPPPPAPKPALRPRDVNVSLTTAAELGGVQTDAPPQASYAADQFHQGMLVRHPEYGLGKIVALSGNGERRRATVAFASAAGEKKFILASSPLRPASNGNS